MSDIKNNMPKEFEMPLQYGVVRGLEFGRGNPRKVIALHGWLDNAASFSRLSPLLLDAHVIAIDLPGHGHSDHRAPGQVYHLVDYVPVVAEMVHRLGWSRYDLVGHSLGAGICSLLASVYAQDVESLVMIDGLGPVSDSADTAPARLSRSVRRHVNLGKKPLPVYRSIDAAVDMRLQATTMDRVSAQAIVERNLREIADGFTWRTDRRVTLASPVYMMEAQVHALIRAVHCPAFLVRASDGVIAKLATSQDRVECYENIIVESLTGHHHLHLDDPRPVAKVINNFWKDLNAEPSLL